MRRFRNTPYFVSPQGDVYREGKTKPLSPDIGAQGYKRVSLCINGKVERLLVHRIVAETYLPKKAGRVQVNHIDNNPGNNAVDNLEWCTQSENQLHAWRQGRNANLIASRQASLNKLRETAQLFREKLGQHFIEVFNENPRNYVRFSCADCFKEMVARTDSSVFNKHPAICRKCLYRRRYSLFSCESMSC